MKETKIAIVGGGTAGISAAAHLLKYFAPSDITIIEPADVHYYQPLWTLVGGGLATKEESARPMASVIPAGTNWIKQKVDSFQPIGNILKLDDGSEIKYEYLVAAPGIQIDWDKIEGLKGNLGTKEISSNYSYDSVDYTNQCLQNFKGGTAVFTFPANPIKCAGAPQKIMWIAEEIFRNNGVRDKSKVVFLSAGGAIFGVEKYKLALEKLVAERNIECVFGYDLVGVDADNKKLKAKNMESGEMMEMDYDFLHITPPQSAPQFIKDSDLSTCIKGKKEEYAHLCSPVAPTDSLGYIDVDKHTTQHTIFKNVFSIGDASSLPASKTGAAVRKQAPVMAKNLYLFSQGKEPTAQYDGYASCPLVVDSSHVILAEFGYDGKILESFPFDQAVPRRSMYILKKHFLPPMYWGLMLKGLL